MGAAYVDVRLPGGLSEQEMRDKFSELQEYDRYENGHSYSGGFGMCTGVSIHKKPGANLEEAENYCLHVAEKWRNAIAVKVVDDRTHITRSVFVDGVIREASIENPNYGMEFWYIGARCAS